MVTFVLVPLVPFTEAGSGTNLSSIQGCPKPQNYKEALETRLTLDFAPSRMLVQRRPNWRVLATPENSNKRVPKCRYPPVGSAEHESSQNFRHFQTWC